MLAKAVSEEKAGWDFYLSGRTKICLLFFQSVYALTVDNPRSLLYGLFFALSLHVLSRTSLKRWYMLSILILLGLWGSMLSQALFYAQPDRTPLFNIIDAGFPLLGPLTGGITVYREGFLYGAVQGLRSASMVTMGLFVCWTSDPRELLRALSVLRIPAEVSFMAVTALRFLPVLAEETGEVITALKLRSGTKFSRSSVLFNIKGIVSPLLARSLRRAQVLSLSVVSRGFLDVKEQTNNPWSSREKFFCAALLAMSFLLLFTKGCYIASEQGFYYNSLRGFYDFSVKYL